MIKIDIQETAEYLRGLTGKITVVSHANPDGDTIGCGYALCRILEQMGKNVCMVCTDKISPRFLYLDNLKKECGSNFKTHFGVKEFAKTDVIITVDTADIKLLGDLEKVCAGSVDLSIDHHISNEGYAKSTCLDSSAAAAAEVVYDIAAVLESADGIKIDSLINVAVYTGIATDTGCFRYSNTTPKTHRIAALIMNCEYDFALLNYTMFEMKTRERIVLEQAALSGIEYLFDGRCAIISVDHDALDKVDSEDSNGISALPRQISGVEVGVVMKERKKGEWKVSVRTGGNNVTGASPDASAICAKLGGGGHKRAAGCLLKHDFVTAREMLVDIIRGMLNE